MNCKILLPGIAAVGLLAGGALAQTSMVEVDDDVRLTSLNAIADDVDDRDVFDAAGVEIGEVEKVIGTDARTPTALIVDFDGKAGYADRDVVVPLESFTIDDNRLVLNAAPDAVGGMETWRD